MVMVENLADSSTCALCDFACAFGGADADVLAGDRCTLADIACSVDRVEGDKVVRTFSDTLGGRSCTLGGSFADVSGTPAEIAIGATLMGLLGGRPRRVGRLRRGLGLALTEGSLTANSKYKCE